MTENENADEKITAIVNKRIQAQRRFDSLRAANPNCMGAEAFRHLTEIKRLEAELAEAEAAHLQWLYARCARFHEQANILGDTVGMLGNICREHGLEEALEPLMNMKRRLDALDHKAANQGGSKAKKPAPRFRFDHGTRN